MRRVAVLSALATLVNPVRLADVGVSGHDSPDVEGHRGVAAASDPSCTRLDALVVGRGRRERVYVLEARPPIERIAMTAMLAYAALRVARTAPLCVVAAVLLMRPTVLASTVQRSTDVRSQPSRSALRGLAVALLAVAVISGAVMTRLARCIPIAGDWSPDLVAGHALIDAQVRGKMVTWFDWGEYTLWHLGGGLRVSMDGRRETIYSDTVLERHFALYEGTPEGLAYLQRLDPDYVWLPASKTGARDWLAAHGYRVDVSTPQSFVAVRGDRPSISPATVE